MKVFVSSILSWKYHQILILSTVLSQILAEKL